MTTPYETFCHLRRIERFREKFHEPRPQKRSKGYNYHLAKIERKNRTNKR